MDSKNNPRCVDCDEVLYSASRYCVRCYKARLSPCPGCNYLDLTGKHHPRFRKGVKMRISCKICNAEGWIFSDQSIVRPGQ